MAFSVEEPGFRDALVILGAAGIVIPAFARFRISPVIGFIAVGLLAGPGGLGALAGDYPWLKHLTISEREAIEPFAEFGIILLLFSIGLELSINRLWSMRNLVFGVGAAELCGSAAIFAGALALLGQPLAGAIALGLALALSSTALVLPMVGTQSPVGRSAFAMLLFEDLAIVPIIFVLGALAPSMAMEDPVEGLIRTLGYGFVLITVMLVAGRLLLPRLFSQAARTKSPELFLAASLLVVIAASLATAAVGLSPIVGALLAGILIAETEYHSEVEVMTAPFRGLALGVFLITVGMSLDLRVIAENWISLALAVLGVVIVKTLVTSLLLRLSGARAATATEAGVLMASPSETTLIVLAAAASAQLISPQTAAFWQIVTAIGLTITPLLARIGRDVSRRIEMGDSSPHKLEAVDDAPPETVIIGFGRVGRMVADMLKAHGRTYLAVEADIDAVARARRKGYSVIFGDASRPELLDRLRLGHVRALVLTMDQPVLSVSLVRRVRGWMPGLTIVARARDPQHATELYKAGASDVVPETLESSLQLSEAVLVDLGVAMGHVIASIHAKRDELREKIKQDSNIDHTPLLRRHRADEAID